MSHQASGTAPAHISGFPRLLFLNGAEQREIQLTALPFRIGRKTGKDLEIPDPRVSRDHAEIVCENGDFYVIDTGSKLGTFVNGDRVDRKRLTRNDRIEFGVGVGSQVVFDPANDKSSAAREFLSQISIISVPEKQSDLEKLALFLEAARKLNTSGALDEILLSLIGTTLKLTNAERGFVFLRHRNGDLQLAAACTAKGERLFSDETISHSILAEAATSASEFVVTDTTKFSEMAARQSIIAHDLRTVIAIPLRKAHAQHQSTGDVTTGEDVIGVLYLDARFVSGNISKVSHDILGVIAREAAALVESTHLALAEADGRKYQQELNIAAAIQQRLMTVTIPELQYAELAAKSIPCKDIGGDFFDVMSTDEGLTVVLTDVSGKGISAAILASILQGLVYAQVMAHVSLEDIVTSANRFLCQRMAGEKYATMIIVRVKPGGDCLYVNCGHVPPVVIRKGQVLRLMEGNMPIGLFAEAEYQAHEARLEPGDRILLVSDGVTEAEDASGEFFGEARLEQAALGEGSCFDRVFNAMRSYCGELALSDDCTLLELSYQSSMKSQEATVGVG
jgi:phosphoserine phosphatase RsbU/P